MKLYDQLKKHPKKIVLVVLLLPILWFCRSFFPMVFWWGDKVTMTFNLPENIQLKKLSAKYMSTNCQEYWYGTGNWANLYKNHTIIEKKINVNQYQAKVFFKDNGLCQWRLESIYWQLEYQDIEKAYPQVAENNGGLGSDFVGQKMSIKTLKHGQSISHTLGNEKLTLVTSFMPQLINSSYYTYISNYYKEKQPEGDQLYFIRHSSEFNGEFGLNTRHIDYTATVIEPPFDNIKRIK